MHLKKSTKKDARFPTFSTQPGTKHKPPAPAARTMAFGRPAPGVPRAPWRDLIAFWILGLLNNGGYNISLAVANEVMSGGRV